MLINQKKLQAPFKKMISKARKPNSSVFLRVALAQINLVVGDFNFNADKIKQHLKQIVNTY